MKLRVIVVSVLVSGVLVSCGAKATSAPLASIPPLGTVTPTTVASSSTVLAAATTAPPETTTVVPATTVAAPTTVVATTVAVLSVKNAAAAYEAFVADLNRKTNEVNEKYDSNHDGQISGRADSIAFCQAGAENEASYIKFLQGTKWPADVQPIVNRLVVSSSSIYAGFDTQNGSVPCVRKDDKEVYDIGTELRVALGLSAIRS